MKGKKSNTKKFNGKKYTKKSCYSKKTDAKKAATAIREKGGTARIVKEDGRNCLYEGPRARKRRKRA